MNEAKVFFDTNVLIYLLSEDETKADRAEEVIASRGTISVQVLNEFATVTTRKLGMSWAEVHDILSQIRAVCLVEPNTIETHHRGLLLAERFRFSIYDAMIVASALAAKCAILYSEDMQDGQVIDGQLTIRNPFSGSGMLG